MSGLLRPGNAGANTAADHITVLDQALAQIPDAHRHGTVDATLVTCHSEIDQAAPTYKGGFGFHPLLCILVRTDSAGSAKAFLTHLRALRDNGLHVRFSVGYAVSAPVRRAIRALPEQVWHPALDADGTLRESAELTGMVDLNGYPAGTRIIVRRERPHPGAQLSLFDSDEGLRHRGFLTIRYVVSNNRTTDGPTAGREGLRGRREPYLTSSCMVGRVRWSGRPALSPTVYVTTTRPPKYPGAGPDAYVPNCP